ncbi:alpha/beta fold hydrolase [Parahaliea aestuarii]|uniref:Alpha/beta fold hydrolase n=1 Tax=Parahaliea aestuarii TaxID=1852021 RepID=A0A5C8ZN37_9GAMM|nr:alpha/beta fold hydrolase [Parahaliea aestuarii]TXS89174.1 alpha/beta fold hydrolase [Parahaliea aestuarii]
MPLTSRSLATVLAMLFCYCAMGLSPTVASAGQASRPTPVEGDFTIHDFNYDDGSVGDLSQHYTTLGQPRRNADGRVTNAVLIMHGTTGSGSGFLGDRYAGVLFGEGALLDASRYYIILTDAIGHGQSSRPSAGQAADFPNYTYDDMVRAQYRLLNEHLQVDHLRLVTGTSMGGMLSWVWGYTYPDFMDALLPLASLPVEIAGRNRMQRKMIIDAVKNDPGYKGGFYDEQPAGLREAMYPLIFMVSSPLQYQLEAPTREESEAMLEALVERYSARMDANDLTYAFDASRFYNPAPHLDNIRAPLLAINSADDQVNPPELGLLETYIGNVPNGEAVTLDITPLTRGHGTHSLPSIWGPYLARFLAATASAEDRSSRDYSALTDLDSPIWQEQAPAQFVARFETTEGLFRIKVERALAPRGADRFYQLVKSGYYDGVHINRVVPGFIAQFGLHGNTEVQALWKHNAIDDDPVSASNSRGTVAFAMTGPDTRSTQVYISTGDNTRLDKDGFAPFGQVIEGMDVVDRLYGLYGEEAGGGLRGGRQGPLEAGGSDYINREYPLLDFIVSARPE